MTTYIIRIDPDGTVTEYENPDLLAISGAAFGGQRCTFTCRPINDPSAPEVFPTFDVFLVGVCHDWAYAQPDATCNPKSWALYGRSPIAGPAFFAHDTVASQREPLDQAWIDKVRSNDWIVAGVMNVEYMRDLAEGESLAWPELVTP